MATTPEPTEPSNIGDAKVKKIRSPRKNSADVGSITLPLALAVPVELAAFMSKFTGRTITPEEVVLEAIVRHLEHLQKHSGGKFEMPATMFSKFTEFKQQLLAEPAPESTSAG